MQSSDVDTSIPADCSRQHSYQQLVHIQDDSELMNRTRPHSTMFHSANGCPKDYLRLSQLIVCKMAEIEQTFAKWLAGKVDMKDGMLVTVWETSGMEHL